MKGNHIEGNHGRIFYLDGVLDPRQILMREISGEYERYFNGELIAWTGKETGAILVAGMSQFPFQSDVANHNSLHSG